MKKSYVKLIMFNIFLVIILLLNSFILNILNFYNMIIFLILSIIIFKLIFGFEKDNHRYKKDIIVNMLIIFLSGFLIYYLFGLLIGFVKTDNLFSFYGMKNFIIPYIIIVALKEFLRYQMIMKSGKSKVLIIIICLLFIFFDITNDIDYTNWLNNYSVFVFFAITLLPAIINNIVCTYIAKKVGYMPNILWLLIDGLYGVILPFVPNTGIYIGSIIKFLFPIVIAYNVYLFFVKRGKNIPISDKKKKDYITIPLLCVLIFVLVYLTSGYFRYYTIAIASGSMTPNIYKGDVVIIDKKLNYDDLKVGQVIAYKYNSVIIVHRLVQIENVNDEFYYYTQGDANNTIDNYIIYEDMIIGVVKFRIPYVGFPTIWLNELWINKKVT